MGAGRVGPADGPTGELVFLGQIEGRGDARMMLRRLSQALAQRGLEHEDLLRLRIFAVDLSAQLEIERALEELLPRRGWPAITLVGLPAGTGNQKMALSLDAIGARGARLERQPIGAMDPGEPHWRPAAVRYGPWVFVGAIVGAGSRALSLPRRIQAQSRSLFERMEHLLGAAGGRLGDVIKVGGWLTFPMSAYKPLGEVRSQLLAQHRLLPASAAVQVGRVAGEGEPLLSFEAIAFAPLGGIGRDRASGAARSPAADGPPKSSARARYLAKPSPLAAYYATARRSGGYVFTCGEIPRADAGANIGRQARDVYEQLGPHLDEHGACPADVVHQTIFVRERGDMSAIHAAGRAFCRSQVPTTVIAAVDMGFRPGVGVEIELVAQAGTGRGESREEGDARRARDAA